MSAREPAAVVARRARPSGIHDRVGRDDFDLTQEYLGQMLGVARARVSTAAAIMRRAEFIRYSRGRLVVTDRQGLEEASCECYRAMVDEYERLLG